MRFKIAQKHVEKCIQFQFTCNITSFQTVEEAAFSFLPPLPITPFRTVIYMGFQLHLRVVRIRLCQQGHDVKRLNWASFFVRRYPDMPCAADVVNTLDQQALASILAAYGEERHARKVASAIVEARRVSPVTRTQQLAAVVAGSETPPRNTPCSLQHFQEAVGRKRYTSRVIRANSPRDTHTHVSENYTDCDVSHHPFLCLSFSCFIPHLPLRAKDETELEVAGTECD